MKINISILTKYFLLILANRTKFILLLICFATSTPAQKYKYSELLHIGKTLDIPPKEIANWKNPTILKGPTIGTIKFINSPTNNVIIRYYSPTDTFILSSDTIIVQFQIPPKLTFDTLFQNIYLKTNAVVSNTFYVNCVDSIDFLDKSNVEGFGCKGPYHGKIKSVKDTSIFMDPIGRYIPNINYIGHDYRICRLSIYDQVNYKLLEFIVKCEKHPSKTNQQLKLINAYFVNSERILIYPIYSRPKKLYLVNMFGTKTILNFEYSGEKLIASCLNIPSGIYHLVIHDGKEMQVAKLSFY